MILRDLNPECKLKLNKLANLRYLFFLISPFFFIACKHEGDKNKILPPSSGKYGEVLVVIDSNLFDGSVGEKVKKIFNKSMPALPQQETQFRMANVDPSGFKSILKRSRNVFKVELKQNSKTGVSIVRDVWAKNQLLIQINASSIEQVESILAKNEQTIRDYYNEEELKRLRFQYLKKPQEKLMQKIEAQFQIQLLIPPAFLEMGSNDTSLWLQKEKYIGEHQVIQGLLIYSYPYVSDSVFAVEELIYTRNLFTQQLIQGKRDSSYMAIYDDFQPIKNILNIHNMYVAEYRGLWNMKNDFMGGPFIHYTFIDEKNQRVVNLDGFVYAPKFNKREYLRELQAIMNSFKFSSTTTTL